MIPRRFDPNRDPAIAIKEGWSFLPLCQRGEHLEQIHHARYDTVCDCPCHRRDGRSAHWWTGERA